MNDSCHEPRPADRAPSASNRRRLPLAAGLLLAFSTDPSLANVERPRLEFATTRLEVAEDDANPVATLRLVHCGARLPAGVIDVRVLAVDGSAHEGVDFYAFGHAQLGTPPHGGGPRPEGAPPQEGGPTRVEPTRVYRDLEIPLEIVHDDLDEETEVFELRAEIDPQATLDCGDGPQPVDLGPPATVHIHDVPKDVSLVSFVTDEFHVTEGDGDDVRLARLVVRRTGGKMPVSVLCQTVRSGTASEAADFEAVESAVGWGENDLEDKACVIPVLPDELPENRETVAVELVPLVGRLRLGTAAADLSIHDDDSPGRIQFRSTRSSASEGEGRAVIEIERRWGSEGEAAVRVRITPRGATVDEDYRAVDSPLTWSDGEAGVRELVVPLLDDRVGENDELLLLHLEPMSPATLLGDLVDAVLVVEDDDS